MISRNSIATLFSVILCALPLTIRAADQKKSISAAEQDYARKLALPTTCGNHPYLASIANDYRTACDHLAREIRGTIRAAGGECDHITLLGPMMNATTVSDVLCVVRGGDVVFGQATNTVEYLVFPARIERLPPDRAQRQAAIDASFARAKAAWEEQARQTAALNRQRDQERIEARRWQAVASDLQIRRKRCDKLLTVEKVNEGGGFLATCAVKGKEKQYRLSFSGLE